MLRSFRIANHKSIKDEQELVLLPSYDKDRLVVPVAAIFGANASGKSNLLDGLRFMQYAARSSFAEWEPGVPIPRSPFKLDPASLAVTARVPVAGAPDGLALGPDGRLVVVAQEGPAVAVVDPTAAAVVTRRILGQLPQLYDQANLAVAATADALWVSSFSENAVHRLSS